MREYEVPTHRKTALWFAVIAILNLPVAVMHAVTFSKAPSREAGIFALLWFVAVGVWGWFAVTERRRMHVVIVDDDGGISLRTNSRGNVISKEAVTTVTRDQIEYHLFSAKNEVSVARKNLPAELAEIFDAELEED